MSNAPHILVIDDEPQILRAMRTILTEKQFKVTTASRGEEGLILAAITKIVIRCKYYVYIFPEALKICVF